VDTQTTNNERFLRNLYAHGPFRGHGFCCSPELVPVTPPTEGDYTLANQPLKTWVPKIIENYERRRCFLAEVGDDSIPMARVGTATHIYAAAFGCPVHRYEDSNPAALPLVRTAAEADRLPEPDIWTSPTLYRVFEMARLVQAELGSDVCLGPPDVQSGFDTACLVWNKEDLFCAMMDDSEKAAVHGLVARCASLLRRFLTEFRREFPNTSPCHCPNVWAPPETAPWLSNDECGAFGNGVFREFCLPELVDLSRTFGGLGMHCCAAAEHQFPLFNEIPGFHAFNRVAARQGYDPILDHFAGPQAPVHVLGWVGDDVIERLVRAAPAGTRFIFERSFKTADEAKAWYARMRQLSPRG
jgi:hypothetical protein